METKTDDVVVCAMSFSARGPDGYPIAITEGTRLRADNPMVATFPDYFAPDADPQALQDLKTKLMAPAYEHGPHGRSARILHSRQRAKRAVQIDIDGDRRSVKKGELLEPSDPIVVTVPDAFEAVQVEV